MGVSGFRTRNAEAHENSLRIERHGFLPPASWLGHSCLLSSLISKPGARGPRIASLVEVEGKTEEESKGKTEGNVEERGSTSFALIVFGLADNSYVPARESEACRMPGRKTEIPGSSR